MSLKTLIFILSIAIIHLHCVFCHWNDEDNLIQPRIFAGREAKRGQFPYAGFVTYIKVEGSVTKKSARCSGTILHKNWGLTAGHCVLNKSSPAFVVGGIRTDGSDGVTYPIRRFYVHEKKFDRVVWDPRQGKHIYTDWYDVAIMRFTKSIQYDDFTKPIHLEWDPKRTHDQDESTFLGFGRPASGQKTPVLLYETTTVLDVPNCIRLSDYEWNITKELHLCISTEYSEKTACEGDSGGPLIAGGKQIGLHIFGECGGSRPSVFLNIPSVFEWIRQHMMECGDPDLYEVYGDAVGTLYEIWDKNEDRCEHPEKYRFG